MVAMPAASAHRMAARTTSNPIPECSMSRTTRSQFAAFKICPMAGVINSLTQKPVFTSGVASRSRRVGCFIEFASPSSVSCCRIFQGIDWRAIGTVFAPDDLSALDHAGDIAQRAKILERIAIEDDEISEPAVTDDAKPVVEV